MAVDVSRTQDVYKDAGQSVNFTTLLLNREDHDAELEAVSYTHLDVYKRQDYRYFIRFLI